MTTFMVTAADAGDFPGGRIAWDVLNTAARHRVSEVERIDLTKAVHVKPYGVAAIAGLAMVRRAEILPPLDSACSSHLDRFGLYGLVAPHLAHDAPRDTTLPLRRLDSIDGAFADEAAHFLCEQIPGGHATFAADIADCIDEAVRNAIQHSGSPVGCLVCGQAFPATNVVEIAILDLGRTIKGHLAASPRHTLLAPCSDDVVIVKATELGVTGAVGTDNSGAGLHTLRTHFEGNPGDLAILSGHGIVVFSHGNPDPTILQLINRFEGTLINLRFRA